MVEMTRFPPISPVGAALGEPVAAEAATSAITMGSSAILMSKDDIRLVAFPSPFDGDFGRLFKMLEGLPEQLGLLYQPETRRVRVLDIQKRDSLEAFQRSLIEEAAAQRVADDPGGEALHGRQSDRQSGGDRKSVV